MKLKLAKLGADALANILVKPVMIHQVMAFPHVAHDGRDTHAAPLRYDRIGETKTVVKQVKDKAAGDNTGKRNVLFALIDITWSNNRLHTTPPSHHVAHLATDKLLNALHYVINVHDSLACFL